MSTSSKPSNVDLADKKAELEQYYIQLLEKRIAALEALTSSSTEAVPDEPSSSTTDPPNNRLRRAPTVVDGTEATTSLEQNEDNKNEEDQKASEEAIRKAERKKRVRAVVSTYDRLKGVRTDSPMSDSLTADKSKNLAFTFRRILPISERGVGRSEVDIESQDLRRLLSQVIGEYTGQSWEGKIVSISSPFAPLIHFWDELQAASKPKVSDDESSRQAREDLEILLEYVGTTSELEKYFKTRESNLKEELTTYEELWTLFIPGKTIFAKPFLGMPQLFVVHSPPFIWDNTKPAPSAINLYCWCYDWNGRTPVKVWYFIKFDHFRGTKPINELVAYPSKFYKSETSSDEIKTEEELISHLVTRGLKFDHTVRGPKGATQQHQYDGEALADRRTVFNKVSGEDDTINPDPERRRQREDNFRPVKVKCPYIVDHEAFLTYGRFSWSMI
ncbi:hypothetical protein B0J14DRAFT_25252 [Halenospora varia]|nr:hypothetical protein B0J14DRAFT_25252 [Halenospora varia]